MFCFNATELQNTITTSYYKREKPLSNLSFLTNYRKLAIIPVSATGSDSAPAISSSITMDLTVKHDLFISEHPSYYDFLQYTFSSNNALLLKRIVYLRR